jgi:hypothetical protein
MLPTLHTPTLTIDTSYNIYYNPINYKFCLIVLFYENIFVSFALLAIATAIAPSLALAGNGAYGDCSPSYGAYNSCIPVTSLIINKTVQDPKTKTFVENLSNTDTRYSPESVVPFKVTVKNTGQ